MIRLLFVGESWRGSCARSLKEALGRRHDLTLEEVSEDLYVPKARDLLLRVSNRLLAGRHRRELERAVLDGVDGFRPGVVMAYKGSHLTADLLKRIRDRNVATVNVYPDYSPHAFGDEHRRAVGSYDLVISTKPFHAPQWRTTYGYENECRFVPQGYDPLLHLRTAPAAGQDLDVAVVATWRPEYGELLRELAARIANRGLRVGIGGAGWMQHPEGLPRDWQLLGPVTGSEYVETLRRAHICLAPLNSRVVANGVVQPGDVDTTRTYELAAAYCFFVHRRTEYVTTLYDEPTEVPMFDDATELAGHLLRYLPLRDEIARMRHAAHVRAVPAYSLDERADRIVRMLRERFPACDAAP